MPGIRCLAFFLFALDNVAQCDKAADVPDDFMCDASKSSGYRNELSKPFIRNGGDSLEALPNKALRPLCHAGVSRTN
ncbi:hypothetical protein [Burkholderia ubonensis]|uniref:hypothetical protein n=1 Tax=Burkholderia ubonensis TaxID=101571 RepID=UPI0018E005A0|nr:hypothetical protein [Burkholderia ubonensis]